MDESTNRPSDPYGICCDCKRIITNAERDAFVRCCRGHIDYSWNAIANPHNAEWEPGYRFYAEQDSQRVGRTQGKMRTRVYRVGFEIDRAGRLRPCKTAGGSTNPTEKTMAGMQSTYERHRPHLPLSREQLQHLAEAWEHANDPTSLAIAAKARALLEALDGG